MTKRRRQGLCYNCDESFARGHQCKHLFFLIVTNEPEEIAADPPDALPATEDAAVLAALLAE